MSNFVRSDVWDHFKKGEKTATCCHCRKELSYCGGTTNLRDHLTRIHPLKYTPETDKSKVSIAKIDTFVNKTVCSESHAKKITNLMAEMLVLDLRPAATVEGVGFRRLINYLEPNYRVPSAMHMAKCVTEKYEAAKIKLIEMLKDPMHIALSTDIWTSIATQAYITVTAHFISPSWELNTFLLQTASFPENHTAENIAEKIKEILTNFSLDCYRIVAVVHDQGSNMEAFSRLMKEEYRWESTNCAAHRIQLCVEDGLKINAIARLVGASRKLVNHFKHSTVATAALANRQKSMSMPVKKLVQDCATRWNSTYYLLERIVETRWPISAVLSDEKVTKRSDRYLDLKNEQWELAKRLLGPLQQIETATVYFSEEENLSISTVLPILFGIMDNLKGSDEDCHTLKEFKQTVTQSIRRRWNLSDLSPILGLCTVLDARFKHLKFLDETTRSDVLHSLQSNTEMLMSDRDLDPDCTMADDVVLTSQDSQDTSYQEDSQDDMPAAKKAKSNKKSALDILLGPEENNEENVNLADEVETYLQSKSPPRSTNIFEWWKINEPRYPNIARLARSMLCIPATSTAAERIFSSAGITVSKRRSCLKPENVDKILFLNKNLPRL